MCVNAGAFRIIVVDSLSDKNPLVKQIRRAVSRGTLTEDGYAVAEGAHLLEEALAAKCEIGAVIVAESARVQLSGCARRQRQDLSRTRLDGDSAGGDRTGAAAGFDAGADDARRERWWLCSMACRTRATPAPLCARRKRSARPAWCF